MFQRKRSSEVPGEDAIDEPALNRFGLAFGERKGLERRDRMELDGLATTTGIC